MKQQPQPTITTDAQLEALLQHDTSWYSGDDSTFRVDNYAEGPGDNPVSECVPHALLAARHPDLAQAAALTLATRDQGISGYAIQCLQAYYQGKCLMIPRSDSNTLLTPEVDNILRGTNDDGAVLWVTALTMAQATRPGYTRPISYLVSARRTEVTVPRAWMDATFPEWEDRLLLAETLGITRPSERMALFKSQTDAVEPPVSLPDLNAE